ncbi:MAG: hypothetical protein J3K34DRAFT_399173 [Monoraphidium minutum]|nr:MAG: hypothetical protein J3K34DRAFT_399173 [Monoraphidium minutum]
MGANPGGAGGRGGKRRGGLRGGRAGGVRRRPLCQCCQVALAPPRQRAARAAGGGRGEASTGRSRRLARRGRHTRRRCAASAATQPDARVTHSAGAVQASADLMPSAAAGDAPATSSSASAAPHDSSATQGLSMRHASWPPSTSVALSWKASVKRSASSSSPAPGPQRIQARSAAAPAVPLNGCSHGASAGAAGPLAASSMALTFFFCTASLVGVAGASSPATMFRSSLPGPAAFFSP